MEGIRNAIEQAVRYLTEHPEEARYTDSYARARADEALRVEVEGPAGSGIVTDMPTAVGGIGEHPSPGWLFRAAIASCVASTIAMESAREGISLSSLEVEVDSESDDRGMLGMDEGVPPGPLSTRVRVTASAGGVDKERLRAVMKRGAERCPVCDATKRAVPVSLEIAAPVD